MLAFHTGSEHGVTRRRSVTAELNSGTDSCLPPQVIFRVRYRAWFGSIFAWGDAMAGTIRRIRDEEDYLTPEEHKARTTAKRDELKKALLTPEPLNFCGLRVLIRGPGAFRLAPGHLARGHAPRGAGLAVPAITPAHPPLRPPAASQATTQPGHLRCLHNAGGHGKAKRLPRSISCFRAGHVR